MYGACRDGERQGSFKEGIFPGHHCICMPAHLSPEELEAKIRNFLAITLTGNYLRMYQILFLFSYVFAEPVDDIK